MTLKAVITGDIIESTKTIVDFTGILQSITEDINEKSHSIKMAFSRGDTFQILSDNPLFGLSLLLIIKAGLRRNSKDKNNYNLQNLLDARMSLGIGKVIEDTSMELGSMRGEAFTYSGRALEKMKQEGAFIKITTGDKELDEQFAAVTPLLDAIIQRWTKPQSEAIYLYLLHSDTQSEIGEKLDISQRGAGKRLEGSNIEKILKYNDYFKNLLKWKLNI